MQCGVNDTVQVILGDSHNRYKCILCLYYVCASNLKKEGRCIFPKPLWHKELNRCTLEYLPQNKHCGKTLPILNGKSFMLEWGLTGSIKVV